MKEPTKEKFPHGMCECNAPMYMECHGYGPAAYLIKRDGVKLRVCTRCQLSSDEKLGLLVTKEDSSETYSNWDALGFMCILFDLRDKAEQE